MTTPEIYNTFILVSLVLLAIVAIMLIIQLIAWIIVVINKKTKIKLTNKAYETLLDNQGYSDIVVKKVKIAVKFANYQSKNNCLKLSKRNFTEKTVWNVYQNLINILLIKWKKEKRKTSLSLIASTIVFYLCALITIILTLIYYLNFWQNTLDQINTTALSIISFIVLIVLVLSWLTWTMNYEKIRKEIIELAQTFDDQNLLKIVKRISNYKTLFPGSELLF